ncbi:biogenesis of lysosome-related organelles complex 1 subunit 3 [Scyliorhinus canicula]|uniref:biogenesis of lysosome-related organelles complex 1 subunit 3 n=1 Tax=Scyliorhinus canicula TaxID=7830 RepID=UPI0018F45CB9|nr:biogenesis of lysosome-related organelles complex 1 subunit 3 [Scyliorhinus canicula]
MASTECKTIIEGEASETDSEEEVYLTSSPPAGILQTGTKVPGEASETDDEEDDGATAVRDIQQAIQRGLPPLIVIRDGQSDILTAVEERPALRFRHQGRFSTLLQQKLRESNGRLHQNVEHAVKLMYESAAKEIRAATSHLSNSQNGIINASHSIRLILEDLKSVTEKMDIITSCNLLPDIQIPPAAARLAQL